MPSGIPHKKPTCSKCNKNLAVRHTGEKGSNKQWCRSCNQDLWHRNAVKRREWQKYYDLKRTYGLTKEDYDSLTKSQDFKCKTCSQPLSTRAAVDHCHSTGDIRGILCMSCNIALGLIKDNITTLKSMIAYLGGNID